MADVFQLGQEGSRSAITAAFEDLLAQGQSLLDQLEEARLSTLLEFNRRLGSVNNRRQQSNRTKSIGTLGLLQVSDFFDINQAQTTATVRADAQSVSLKERQTPVDAEIGSIKFLATNGAVEILDSGSNMYRVHTNDDSVPAGQFDITLVVPLTLNLVVFDIVSIPSEPTVIVQVSADGVNFVNARESFRNGYRVNALLPAIEVKYVRVKVIPTHADTISGSSYSFGLTAFNAATSQYHLRSELLTRTVTMSPKTEKIRFLADKDSDIVYFLSFNGGSYFEALPDDILDIPGVTTITPVAVNMNSSGVLAHTLPANTYLTTLLITEQRLVSSVTTDVPIPIIQGLSNSDPRILRLEGEFIGVNGTALSIVRSDGTFDTGRTFTVSYSYGPSQLVAQLKVRLATDDPSVTPTFHGASLEEL